MQDFAPLRGKRPLDRRGEEGTDVLDDWDALYARLSTGADALGDPLGEQVGDLSMWDVPWSATETGGPL
ncbi:hypothetical protein [Kitasatospora sp. NPDC058218]|uniref:hypothetical protein n=1 Tax=Kitasatospora sp. NPDC058218 TaxID=3346385 RepID=UPI0036D871C2